MMRGRAYMRARERSHLTATMRFGFRSELELLLELAGLRALNVFGDYRGSRFSEGSRELIAVCERAENEPRRH